MLQWIISISEAYLTDGFRKVFMVKTKVFGCASTLFLSLLSLSSLAACSDPTPTVTISNWDWGFAKGSTNAEVVTDITDLSQYDSIYPYTTYFLVYSFSVQTDMAIEDQTKAMIDITLTLGTSKVIQASLFQAPDASAETVPFSTSSGTNDQKSLVHVYAPKTPNTAVKKQIQIRYSATGIGSSAARVTFAVNTSSKIKMDGDIATSGFYRSIQVDAIKLTTPVVTFNQTTGLLQWKHIDHATAYKIVVDTSSLNETGSQTQTVSAPTGATAGDALTYDISQMTVFADKAVHKVKVQATSDDPGYGQSDFSTAIDVQLA